MDEEVFKQINTLAACLQNEYSSEAHANGRNIVDQQPPTTRNNVVTCCVRLHGPLRYNYCFVNIPKVPPEIFPLVSHTVFHGRNKNE